MLREGLSALLPGGVLLNGDEVRPAADADYLRELNHWHAHMNATIAAGRVPEPMRHMLARWAERNIDRFDAPRTSGDDCHDTSERQLAMLAECGFARVDVAWSQQMWAILRAVK